MRVARDVGAVAQSGGGLGGGWVRRGGGGARRKSEPVRIAAPSFVFLSHLPHSRCVIVALVALCVEAQHKEVRALFCLASMWAQSREHLPAKVHHYHIDTLNLRAIARVG
jgi:hypothetical protein